MNTNCQMHAPCLWDKQISKLKKGKQDSVESNISL
jgi:hypothetical protein